MGDGGRADQKMIWGSKASASGPTKSDAVRLPSWNRPHTYDTWRNTTKTNTNRMPSKRLAENNKDAIRTAAYTLARARTFDACARDSASAVRGTRQAGNRANEGERGEEREGERVGAGCQMSGIEASQTK